MGILGEVTVCYNTNEQTKYEIKSCHCPKVCFKYLRNFFFSKKLKDRVRDREWERERERTKEHEKWESFKNIKPILWSNFKFNTVLSHTEA